MKINSLIFLLLLSVSFVQAQVLVSYNKSDDVDFSSYQTYQIEDVEVTDIPEFEAKKEGLDLLTAEINKQMQARGYEKVNENPNLIINLGVNISKEVQTRETDIRTAPIYTGQRNYYWEAEEVVVSKYIEGTVTLDLVDVSKNEMIWQAISAGVLEKKQDKNKKKIVRSVQKLFKKYPVKAPKN